MQTTLPAALTPVLLARPRVSWLENLLTIVFGFWLIAGVFVDGFAHRNLRSTIEDFFTPWHAILYSGFMVTALWTTWLIAREARLGKRGLAAVPVGYELGLLGAIIFGLGGVGDMLWHQLFGIEVGVGALLSPTHLMLLLGGVLVVTSPLRNAWAVLGGRPGFFEFVPALLSSVAALSFVSFMNMYLWGVNQLPDSLEAKNWFVGRAWDQAMLRSMSGILFTNVVLMLAVLMLVRRWQTPFGTFVVLFGTNTALMALLDGQLDGSVVVGLLTGLIADLFVLIWRPSQKRLLELRAFAMLVPLVLWGLHFLQAQLWRGGIGLEREMWTGVTVMAAFSGLALSALVAPPVVPEEA